jgi:hypothetical protein
MRFLSRYYLIKSQINEMLSEIGFENQEMHLLQRHISAAFGRTDSRVVMSYLFHRICPLNRPSIRINHKLCIACGKAYEHQSKSSIWL